MRRHVLASWHNPMGLIHMAAIFFRETEKALFYHPRPCSEKLGSEARRVKKVTLVSRVKKAAVWQRPMKVSCERKQHWGLVWSLLSCKWVVLFGSPLIGSVWEQWFGNRKSSEMVGRHRRSSAVGSRWSKKKEHLSCYYTIVKVNLYMCMKGEADTCGREKGPLRRAQAQTRTHA